MKTRKNGTKVTALVLDGRSSEGIALGKKSGIGRAFFRLALLTTLAALSAQSYAQSSTVDLGERAQERRVALVIGNADYDDGRLSNPVHDARLMADALRQTGFDVTLKTNLGQKEMVRQIRAFTEQLKQGGVGLFYFAGHGMQVNGINYLIPVKAEINSELDVELEAVRVERVLAGMEDARNRANVIILDACRNNPFARSTRSGNRGLAFVNAPSGTIIAYATAPGAVASDGSGSNGTYTEALAQHMKTAGLKIEDVLKAVRRDVKSKTNNVQVPWDASSLTSDFYFVMPRECPEGARMREGKCERLAVCPDGATLHDGECVRSAVCPQGTKPVDGECVADVVCPAEMKYDETQKQCVYEGDPPVAPPLPKSPDGGSQRQDPVQDRGTSGAGSFPWRPLAIGSGIAGLGLGVVATGVALSKKSTVDEMCEGKTCYPEAEEEWQSANNWATVATVGAVAGTALLATGLFILTSDYASEHASRGPRLSIGAGPDSASIGGSWRF